MELNRMIHDHCVRSGITYIDLYSIFLKNNELDHSLTYDGLHPNGFGYLKWVEAIKRYL